MITELMKAIIPIQRGHKVCCMPLLFCVTSSAEDERKRSEATAQALHGGCTDSPGRKDMTLTFAREDQVLSRKRKARALIRERVLCGSGREGKV